MQPSAPVKDEDNQRPVADVWRPPLSAVVSELAKRNYRIRQGIAGVARVSPATAEQMERAIAEYGETLAPLPEETWRTSISIWMGTHWECLVDLWTVEGGKSDLVLEGRIFERPNGYEIDVGSVYVP